MNLIGLKQKLHENLQRQHALAAIVEGDDARAWTDEERAEMRDLQAQEDTLNFDIAALERQRRAELTMPSVTVGHDNREDAPWGPPVPAGATAQQREKILAIGLGAQLQAIMRAQSPGGSIDPRLVGAAGPSGASAGVPADAGFLIQTQYSDFLLNRSVESAVLAPLCDNIPIGEGADSLEAPYIDETSRATGSRWGGVQVYRRAEADTVTATKPKFGAWELRLEDLMGIAYATDRSLRDAVSLGAVFSKAFISEFGFTVDDEIFRGDGVGRCLGLIDAANASLVTISKETGQPADTVNVTNLSKMWARMPARLRAGAVWFYNQELDPVLDEMTLPAGTAALEPRFVTYDANGIMRIKGRPAVPLEQASAPGDVGDILLANMSEYALISKGGIDAQESIHVRFLYGERTFRWMYSINGQPKWRTSLTPYKGSNPLSPFVVIEAR